MGWDERLFGAFFRRAQALFRPARKPPPPGSLDTALVAGRLELLAGLLTGERVNLRRLRLPARFEAGQTGAENELVALAHVARAAAALRLGLSWSDESTRPLATALAQPMLLAALSVDLPGAAELLQRADQLAARGLRLPVAAADAPRDAQSLARAVDAAPRPLAPVLTLESWGLLPTPAEAAAAIAEPPLHAGAGASGTEREGRRREVRRVDLGEEKLDENPITHSFEKVHTAEEYSGGKKRTDGADELAEHADALDELDLDQVTRSGERAKSIYRAELELDGATGDVAGEQAADAVAYDEWDGATGRYRERWCAVRERRLPSAAGSQAWQKDTLARYRAQLHAIQADFARLASSRVWRGRQLDGPEVDHDAMADRHAALRSGHQPPEHLYANRRRHERDLSVHLLLDGSLSSDAWVANRRVLDVAREALVVLGEALRTERIDTSAAVFCSHTRQDCRFNLVKDFHEPWDVAHGRLFALTPDGYTRIGPALRHATWRLNRQGARRKLLVLVSDAKPTDYDRYEGRHGLADVARAVHEARNDGVVVHALAIDATRSAHLPRMFGRGGYHVLPRPELLPRALGALFEELAR